MVILCHGITKFPDSNNGNYAMVLSYGSEGNLRDYLQNNHSKNTYDKQEHIYIN